MGNSVLELGKAVAFNQSVEERFQHFWIGDRLDGGKQRKASVTELEL
ncbi:MAG: hypothetical protein IPK16_07825 [Anaerolineales bacterium]|nr:hypothetical protein [Anaerolineales bacterium]